jgi:hypothetical protein
MKVALDKKRFGPLAANEERAGAMVKPDGDRPIVMPPR